MSRFTTGTIYKGYYIILDYSCPDNHLYLPAGTTDIYCAPNFLDVAKSYVDRIMHAPEFNEKLLAVVAED